MDDELELQLKREFADQWLRMPRNAFGAAMEITNGDASLSLRISSDWQFCPVVKAIKKSLVEEFGEDAFLPSRAQLVNDCYGRSQLTPNNDEFVKLIRLIADMRGMIEKPSTNIVNNVTNTVNKVMSIPVYVNATGNTLNSQEWEQSLIQQQKTLVLEN